MASGGHRGTFSRACHDSHRPLSEHGDRGNNRLQVFDLDGHHIGEFKQFSRPSGIYITDDDTIYVADSESAFDEGRNPGWTAGIRVGSLRNGSVHFFIDGTGSQSVVLLSRQITGLFVS